MLALNLFTGRKVAFALLSFLCLKQPRYLRITSLEGAGVPPQLQKLLLRGGGLALSEPGCFIAVLPLQRSAPFGPWPVFTRSREQRCSRDLNIGMCVAARSLFLCLTPSSMGWTLWKLSNTTSITSGNHPSRWRLLWRLALWATVSVHPFWFLFSFHFCRNHRAAHTGQCAHVRQLLLQFALCGLCQSA